LKGSGDAGKSPKKIKSGTNSFGWDRPDAENAASRLVSEPHRLRFAGD
jgi:hypothetical protein